MITSKASATFTLTVSLLLWAIWAAILSATPIFLPRIQAGDYVGAALYAFAHAASGLVFTLVSIILWAAISQAKPRLSK